MYCIISYVVYFYVRCAIYYDTIHNCDLRVERMFSVDFQFDCPLNAWIGDGMILSSFEAEHNGGGRLP
jgi:hypothetical protein